MIDSGQVPRGKGEKQPGEGDEIVSETVCLQRAGVSLSAQALERMTVFLLKNEPASMLCVACLSPYGTEAKGNRV